MRGFYVNLLKHHASYPAPLLPFSHILKEKFLGTPSKLRIVKHLILAASNELSKYFVVTREKLAEKVALEKIII